MISPFSNYDQIRTVYEGHFAYLYRAVHESGKPVIIKLLKSESSLEELSSLQGMRNQSLDQDLILQPKELLYVNQHLGFVFEDEGLLSLRELQEEGGWPLEKVLRFGLTLSGAIFRLHQKEIYHQDLTPGNLLLSKDLQKIRLIGFHGFEQAAKKPGHSQSEDLFFAYTAPELLGEAPAEHLDLADLYSVGCILYELLCGKPPFSELEPLKRIRRRMAQRPMSLQEIDPSLPKPLCKIIDKLLSPNPQERYSHSKHLLEDLAKILRELENNLPITDFEPESGASQRDFLIPNKLYGAQESIDALKDAWERVEAGQVEVFTIGGKAGLGKTSLVETLREPIAESRGIYVDIKLNSLHKDTPYYALQNAFIKIVKHLLGKPQEQIQLITENLQKELTPNGQVLIDFVPELEYLIGPQGPIPKLESTEAKQRFFYCCSKFLQVIGDQAIPLALWLDNCHFIDSGSLELLQSLLQNPNSRYLLLIISYRDAKVVQRHNLKITLEEIERGGLPIHQLKLHPFGIEEINLLLTDALGTEQDFSKLADLILQKTDGNPFFIKQLLGLLYEKELIRFDPLSNRWRWDFNKIHGAALSDDVIELMTEKIKKLPEETQKLIRLSACLGSRFDLKTLSWITERPKYELFEALSAPIKAGLVVEELNFRDPQDANNQSFQFMHSRVLQATYSSLGSDEKKRNHRLIGQVLLEHRREEASEEEIFAIVNHLNQGIQLITDPKERNELAALNLEAGDLSKRVAAYDSAWRFYSLGVNLLSNDSWESDYELTKELYLKGAESEFYSGNTESLTPFFNILDRHIKTDSERIEVTLTQIRLLIKSGRFEEATELGVNSLARFFDQVIPPNDAELSILADETMLTLSAKLTPEAIKNLLFLSVQTDQKMIDYLRFMAEILPAAYVAKPALWTLLTLRMVQESMSHGNGPVSAVAYINYGVLLCSGMRDYRLGVAVSKLALSLNQKFGNQALESQLNFLFGSFINHWESPAKKGIEYLKKAYDEGMRTGDLYTAASALQYGLAYMPLMGVPLEEIQRTISRNQDFAIQLKNQDLFNVLEVSKLSLLLQQPIEEQSLLKTSMPGEDALVSSLKTQHYKIPLQWYYLASAQIHFHFGEVAHALKLIEEADQIKTRYSQFTAVELVFYHSLIILANYPHMSLEEKKRHWSKLKANQAELKQFAESSPFNFEDKYLLVSAEITGTSGNFMEAMDLYDQAVQAAQKGGFVQNQALAFELASRYFHLRHKDWIARAYFREACQAYIRWGASAKVHSLEMRFPKLASQDPFKKSAATPESPLSQNLTRLKMGNDLADFEGAIAAMALEANPKKIRERFLSLFLELSEAERVGFLRNHEGRLDMVGWADLNKEGLIELVEYPASEEENISQSVLTYAQRTNDLVYLGDATKDSLADDRYIKEKKPRSILCFPLRRKGALMGMVYLENNLLSFAFDDDKIQSLQFLGELTATALENGRLYADLARSTEELSREHRQLKRKLETLEANLQQSK